MEEEPVTFKEYFVPFTSRKAIVFIVLIGFLVYANSLFGEFLSDDLGQIVNNPFVHSLSNLVAFFKGSTFYSGGQLYGAFYRPLQTLSYSLIYVIFGANSFPYHLAQLAIHIGNVVLLFLIFRNWFSVLLAFSLSLLFLVHPMNAESVAFIAELGVVLSAFFGLLAFWVTLKKNSTIKSFFAVMSCLLAAILFHETGVLFTVMVLVYELFFDKKWSRFLVGAATVGLIYLFLRFVIATLSQVETIDAPLGGMHFSQRLINIPSIILFYFSTFLFPLKLSFMQRWVVTDMNWFGFYFPLIILMLLIGGIGFLGNYLFGNKKEGIRIYIFFFIWIVVCMLPFMQFIPADATVEDRWFYVPMIGLLGLMGIIFKKLVKGGPSKILIVLMIVVVTLLSGRTIVRNLDWSNQFALYSHDLEIDQNNTILLAGLGKELYKQGKMEEAQFYLEKAVQLGGRPSTVGLLGNVYLNKGEIDLAKKMYEASLQKDQVPDVVVNYSLLLLKTGDNVMAEQFIKSKLDRFGHEFELWLYMAIAEHRLGKDDEALSAAERAYQMRPNQQTGYVYNQLLLKKPLELQGL